MGFKTLLREYGYIMVTKGSKLREYQSYGYRMKKKQPKFKLLRYEK